MADTTSGLSNTSADYKMMAAQAGTQIATGIVGNIFQKRNIRLQKEANMQLADYQYSKDLDMWNRANTYNEPVSQMQRYQDAGLNPNLIYGTGTASAGNSPNVLPQYQAPEVQYNLKNPFAINPMEIIGDYQNYQIRNNTIGVTDANRRIAEANALMAEIDAELYKPKETIGIRDEKGLTIVADPGVGKYKAWERKNKSMSSKYQADWEKETYEDRVKGVKLGADRSDIAKKSEQIGLNWKIAQMVAQMIGQAMAGISNVAKVIK